ncbi:hypothetical protein D3C86_913560 [compost metagenome]
MPFQLIIDSPFTKLVPFTVNVKPASPAILVFGLIVVIAGFGFTVTTTSSLVLLNVCNFQLKKVRNVPLPLLAVIDMVPFV